MALAQLLGRFIKLWQGETGRREPVLHDPLAVAAVFKKDLFALSSYHIQIETKGEFTKGFIVPLNSSSNAPNAQVAVDINESGFLRLFMSRILS